MCGGCGRPISASRVVKIAAYNYYKPISMKIKPIPVNRKSYANTISTKPANLDNRE